MSVYPWDEVHRADEGDEDAGRRLTMPDDEEPVEVEVEFPDYTSNPDLYRQHVVQTFKSRKLPDRRQGPRREEERAEHYAREALLATVSDVVKKARLLKLHGWMPDQLGEAWDAWQAAVARVEAQR